MFLSAVEILALHRLHVTAGTQTYSYAWADAWAFLLRKGCDLSGNPVSRQRGNVFRTRLRVACGTSAKQGYLRTNMRKE
jgi:hypothetical protein